MTILINDIVHMSALLSLPLKRGQKQLGEEVTKS